MSSQRDKKSAVASFQVAIERATIKCRNDWDRREGTYGPLNPDILKMQLEAIAKIATEERLDKFRIFAGKKAKQLEGILCEIIDVYTASLSPEGVSDGREALHDYLEDLRTSLQSLRDAFSSDFFESHDSQLGLMDRVSRLQFLERLEQADTMIILAQKVIDKDIAQDPSTRKKGGDAGHRVLFGLNIGQIFQREFGKPHDRYVSKLTEVLFDVDDLDNAVRMARLRLKYRPPVEPNHSIPPSGDFKSFVPTILKALQNK